MFEDWGQFDYDKILRILQKTKGWGVGSMAQTDNFESSEYFKNPIDEHEYSEQFHIYLSDLSRDGVNGWKKTPSLPLGKWKTGPTVMSPTSFYSRVS